MNSADIAWFKAAYSGAMVSAVAGTFLTVDHLTTIAMQETGYLWSQLRTKPGMTPDKVAALCCGDTLDADAGRAAFPRTAADLKAAPNGPRMFEIARKAILDLADHVKGYDFARRKVDEFAHGFGIWQYDIQFFKIDPAYFLERHYERAEESARKAVGELMSAARREGIANKDSITDDEFYRLAIRYNSGRYDPSRGLKQGHKNDAGKYYGECIAEFLAMVRRVSAQPVVEVPAYEIAAVQTGLNTLGYAAGAADGVMGRLTVSAISGFQHDHGLPVTGQWSPECRAALDRALAEKETASVSAARAEATAADLKAAGSETVKAADEGITAGQVIAGLGVAGGGAQAAQSVGLLDQVNQVSAQISGLQYAVQSLGSLMQWALEHWWIVAIAAGAFVVWKNRKIIAARIADHRSGANTGR